MGFVVYYFRCVYCGVLIIVFVGSLVGVVGTVGFELRCLQGLICWCFGCLRLCCCFCLCLICLNVVEFCVCTVAFGVGFWWIVCCLFGYFIDCFVTCLLCVLIYLIV